MALGVQLTKSSWRYLREQCHRAPNGGGCAQDELGAGNRPVP